MSELEEVVRWSSAPDAPEGMRELLRGAAEDGPTAAELASLKLRMTPQLGAPSSAGWPLRVRVLLGAAVVIAVGLGIVGYLASRPEREAVPPIHELVEPVHEVVPPPVHEVAPPPPPPSIVAPTTDLPAAHVPSASPAHVAAVHAQAPIASPDATQAPAASPAPVPAPEISEVALLEQARAALRGHDPAHALALVDQHARQYADGVLIEEREALAIETLSKLGRHDEASMRWSKFATTYPRSNYRARLQRLMDVQVAP
ncbi:MAG: hypothetical protein ABJE66_06625 [Deltaproteobacteria bacterium]